MRRVGWSRSKTSNTWGLPSEAYCFATLRERIVASHQALKDFKHRLKGLTSRSWGVSMAERIERLNRYLRGWMNYFGISQHYRPIEALDGWLRRRMRMCYWKQWRRPRTRITNLLKLGTTKRQAILTSISRKGYWRLSKTLATHTGMTNEWLEQQGLLSIKQLWMKVQGYV
ncbi:group II intron maturase-specific domain-containing protein [Pantanalinema rosaneae CENA516]|uniref:group II intron maturase-specific domain-containing protein n=2 Tax=Pantanalinema rosaneae TaxID=1620701 RepID=UPI003D6F7436